MVGDINNLTKWLKPHLSSSEYSKFTAKASQMNRETDENFAIRQVGRVAFDRANRDRYTEMFSRFQEINGVDFEDTINSKEDLEEAVFDALAQKYAKSSDDSARRSNARKLTNSFAEIGLLEELLKRRKVDPEKPTAVATVSVAKAERLGKFVKRLKTKDIEPVQEDIGRSLTRFEARQVFLNNATKIGDQIIIRTVNAKTGKISYRNKGRFSKSPSLLIKLKGLA